LTKRTFAAEHGKQMEAKNKKKKKQKITMIQGRSKKFLLCLPQVVNEKRIKNTKSHI
jgi:hypothetical protein